MPVRYKNVWRRAPAEASSLFRMYVGARGKGLHGAVDRDRQCSMEGTRIAPSGEFCGLGERCAREWRDAQGSRVVPGGYENSARVMGLEFDAW